MDLRNARALLCRALEMLSLPPRAGRHRAFIPVVGSGGQHRLWEVYCSPADTGELKQAEQMIDRGRIPTVALLPTGGPSSSGRRAYQAVKRLLAPDTHGASGLVDAVRVRNGTPEDWSAAIQGASSDLGIALCLLLQVAGSRIACVAATGELVSKDTPSERDVAVAPVNGVPEKLALLAERKRAGALPAALKWVFTPEQYRYFDADNQETLALVGTLPEVAELKALGLEVCPVATLAEAARLLGIDPERIPQYRRWGRWAFGSAALALLLLGFCALSVPAHMQWEARLSGLSAKPYAECPLTPGGDGVAMEIPPNNQIPARCTAVNWRIRMGHPGQDHGYLEYICDGVRRLYGDQGYHLATVMVGKKTGINDYSIQVPDQSQRVSKPLRLLPGQSWNAGRYLDGTAEETLLVVMARRFGGFDVAALRAGLEQRFGGSPNRIDFTSIEEYLSAQAGFVLKFRFETR